MVCLPFPEADWTLLSEETAKEQLTEGQPLPAEWLWILDPLDGTKDFLQGTGEYAVHLALVRDKRPVILVLCCCRKPMSFGSASLAKVPGVKTVRVSGRRFASATEPRFRI